MLALFVIACAVGLWLQRDRLKALLGQESPRPSSEEYVNLIDLENGDQTFAESDGREADENQDASLLSKSSETLVSLDEALEISGFVPQVNVKEATVVLTKDLRRRVHVHLPSRLKFVNWKRSFSTAQDGYSLRALARRLHEHKQIRCGSVLVLSTDKAVISVHFDSAGLSLTPRASTYYGDSDTTLCVFPSNNGKMSVYRPTGANQDYVHVEMASKSPFLSIGSSKAENKSAALVLRHDLATAVSSPCETFSSPTLYPLTSDQQAHAGEDSRSAEFDLHCVELWLVEPAFAA
ncbi:MAG: hypothetical protein MHM6MM_004592 [Cercozoa sp. M6MM]